MTTSDKFPDILRDLWRNQPLTVLATAAVSAPYANLTFSTAHPFSQSLSIFLGWSCNFSFFIGSAENLLTPVVVTVVLKLQAPVKNSKGGGNTNEQRKE